MYCPQTITMSFYGWQRPSYLLSSSLPTTPLCRVIAHLSHFPHKINSTFLLFLLFQLVTPRVGSVLTRGASYKKHNKGTLLEATCQISKL